LSQVQFDHRQAVDREQLLAYFASMSWIAVLPDKKRRELLNEVRGLLDADAYTRFWRADVYWTRLAA
jgi:arginine/ornithine N-succinyltransferase beta subunit